MQHCYHWQHSNAIQLVKCTAEKHCGAYSHKTDTILLINDKAAMAKHVLQSLMYRGTGTEAYC